VIDSNSGAQCILPSTNCPITASQEDTIEIFGQGFNPAGGDEVKFVSGSSVVWLYNGDGSYFWDGANQRTQINAMLPCAIAPGAWTYQVSNPSSGVLSTAYAIDIVASSSCP
jgi:hypothetical protein